MNKLALSISETAKLLSISKSTCYSLVEQELLPHIHVTEKRIIVLVTELEAWLKAKSKGGNGTQPEREK